MRFSGNLSQPAAKLLLGSCLPALLAALVWADEPAPLGVWGDPGRVVVEGATAFGNKAVKSALFRDLDLLLAAHPAAPSDEYFPALRKKTAMGYRHAGFLDVAVTTQTNVQAEQVIVEIEEGPRYLAGEIRVTGGASVATDVLIDRLKQPRPPEKGLYEEFRAENGETAVRWLDEHGRAAEMQDPAWQPGEPIPLAKKDREWLHARIKIALADLGYFFPKFSEDVVREPDRSTGHLKIRIENQGHRAFADQIEMIGNKKNTREEILEYLELQPGEALTGRDYKRLEYRLWRSGRFIKHRVTAVQPEAAGRPVVTRIELTEYAKAPRLSEELSPEETTLLKFGRWFTSIDRRPEDMVCQVAWDNRRGEVVVSPEHGIVMLLYDSTENQDESAIRSAAVFSTGLIAYHSARSRERLFVPVSRAQVKGEVVLSIEPQPDDPEKPFRVKFSLGIESADEAGKPFRPAIGAPPVFFVASVHEDSSKMSWQDNQLVVDIPVGRFRIEGSSGKLLEYTYEDPSAAGTKIRVTMKEGRFDGQIKEVEAATAEYPNAFDAEHRWSSIARFLLDDDPGIFWEVLDKLADDKMRGALGDPRIRKLLWNSVGQRVFGALNGFGKSATELDPPNREFEIQRDYRGGFDNPLSAYLIASFGILAPDTLFPRRSWPWTLWREIVFLTVSRPKYLGGELERIYQSPSSGPVALLAAATAIKRNPQVANLIARRGLERLTIEYFRNDFDTLLAADYLSGEIAVWIAEDLRSMKEEDVELLGRGLLGESSGLLSEAARFLRDHPSMPIDRALSQALDDCWRGGLAERVRAALEALVTDVGVVKTGVPPAPRSLARSR